MPLIPALALAAALGTPGFSAELPQAGGRGTAILLGGGCEDLDDRRNNMSAAPIQAMESALGKRNWMVRPLYGRLSTREELLAALDQAIAEKPPQLLLSFITHGRPAVSGMPHSLCVLGKDGKPAPLPVNDPALHDRLRKLKDGGARIGITDGSCYGGASIDAFGQYGCVVTNQARDRVAWGNGVHESIARSTSPETGNFTLEDAWKDALFNDRAARLGYPLAPMISDFAEDGRADAFARALIEPLSRKHPGSKDPSEMIRDIDYCLDRSRSLEADISDLLADLERSVDGAAEPVLVAELERITRTPPEPAPEALLASLKKRLGEYQALHLSYEDDRAEAERLYAELANRSVELPTGPLLEGLSESKKKELIGALDLNFHLEFPRDRDYRPLVPKLLRVNGFQAFKALRMLEILDGSRADLWGLDKATSDLAKARVRELISQASPEWRNQARELGHRHEAAREKLRLSVNQISDPTRLPDGSLARAWTLKSEISRDVNKLRLIDYLKRRGIPGDGPCARFAL